MKVRSKLAVPGFRVEEEVPYILRFSAALTVIMRRLDRLLQALKPSSDEATKQRMSRKGAAAVG